ncbi:TRAP transporter substrate-binding protein [Bosea sp. NPDC003192]|uniref:TRAP transporter substrate-binding protein n=1 Tax=Bosea sp. NPDC003192 TaxID=3390551 RepID=UPI003D00E09A
MIKIDRRSFLGASTGAAASLAMPHIARAQSPVVMKIGSAPINDPQHEWMRIYARHVEALSAGGIKCELYPASQLGAIPRMIEGTQLGTVQAWIGPPEFLTGIDARFSVLGAPYVFKDTAHAQRTLQNPEFADAYAQLGGNKGLRAIGMFATSPALFAMRNKIDDLGGFKGRKIRVFASAWQTEPLKTLGATAVPMSLAEVLPALQQGTLDGVMSSISQFTTLRFYDAAPFAVDLGHAEVNIVVVGSKRWYEGLAPNLQKAVDEAGRLASTEIVAPTAAFVAEQEKIWTQNKGTVLKISATDQARLKAEFAPVAQRATQDKPAEKAMYDLLVKAAQAVA